jgi:hypothetical protein
VEFFSAASNSPWAWMTSDRRSRSAAAWRPIVGFVTAIGLGALVGIFPDVSVGRMAVATVAVTELADLHPAVGGYLVYGLAAAAEPVEAIRTASRSTPTCRGTSSGWRSRSASTTASCG